jgi:hypothetical protein
MKAEGEEEVGGVEEVEEVGGSDDVLIFAMSVCPPPPPSIVCDSCLHGEVTNGIHFQLPTICCHIFY